MEIRRARIDHPSAWRAGDIARDRSWIVTLTPAMIDELEAAVGQAMERGWRVGDFDPRDIPIPLTQTMLDRCLGAVQYGRGFVVLRGLPIERYDLETCKLLYWILIARLGTPVTQTLAGELMARIADFGFDVNRLNVKPSQTSAEQRPHSDPADIVALLCVSRPVSGGTSRIASSIAIHNEILATHPEYLEALYRGFHHDLRGDASADSPFGVTPFPIPVYRWYDGVLSCVFNASTIKDAERRMPHRVPEADMRAVDAIVDLARDDRFRVDMEFQPGDIQLLNNHTCLHWRTAFRDDAEHRRLLLRFWLNTPGTRPIDPEMAAGYITGARTGVALTR
jgi:hypothetical protein